MPAGTGRRFFTSAQKLSILQKAEYRCELCSVDLTADNFHCDHKIPWSLGGATTVFNGQALCANCNLKKGARL